MQYLLEIIEKKEETKRPLYLQFIDYTKAIVSISHYSLLALQYNDVTSELMELIQDIYSKSVNKRTRITNT